MSRITPWVLARPRIRRALPAALFALAFVTSLAAAAPHSVHHLGQELERQPVVCPAALAWGAASGTDCPVVVNNLGLSLEANQPFPEVPAHPRLSETDTSLGRAPPPAITL